MRSLLPQLPSIPGIPTLIFRDTVGDEDTDGLFAVHTRRSLHDGVDSHSTVGEMPRREDVRAMLTQAAERGQRDRVLVAQIDSQVAGYSRVTSWREADGMCVLLILGWVLPEWRGRGIGTTMLRWGEARARALAATEYPGEKFEFAANASGSQHDATALLLHEGYCVGYTVLEMEWEPRELIPTALPSGLQARPALPQHYGQIAASVAEGYRDEYPNGRFMESDDPVAFASYLAEPQHDPSLWQVAWDGDQVAGQVLSRIQDNRGEVFEVTVRPAWRRRGLARALLTHAIQSLVNRQVDAIRLHTVAEFPTRACDLYWSVGFRVVKKFPRYRKTPRERLQPVLRRLPGPARSAKGQ